MGINILFIDRIRYKTTIALWYYMIVDYKLKNKVKTKTDENNIDNIKTKTKRKER